MKHCAWRPPRLAAWQAGASLLFFAQQTRAHGEAIARSPWLEGAGVLFGDPPSLLAMAALVLWCTQQGPRGRPATLRGYGVGLGAGAILTAAGWVFDATLALLSLALLLGLATAWARLWPARLPVAVTAALACTMVLMLAPAPSESLGFRLPWLAAVLMMVALLFATVYQGLLALWGRKPGPVRQLLLRVAGSWLAAAALLVLVLELQARAS